MVGAFTELLTYVVCLANDILCKRYDWRPSPSCPFPCRGTLDNYEYYCYYYYYYYYYYY